MNCKKYSAHMCESFQPDMVNILGSLLKSQSGILIQETIERYSFEQILLVQTLVTLFQLDVTDMTNIISFLL